MKLSSSSSLFGFILLFIIGCGGGGGGSDSGSGGGSTPPANKAPTVTVENLQGAEGTTIGVTATASDSDGSIASYAWTQVSGETVTLTDADKATVSFIAPSVVENTEIVLKITVTDDDGATASADVTVTVTANVITLTIQGIVTDDSMASSNISAKVGTQEFTAVADANGTYSVQLSVDDSILDQIVTLTATESGANNKTKFVSLLGNLGGLVSAAGGDKILTRDEDFGVNITNVSTAIVALMEDENGDNPIATKTEYEEVLKTYDVSFVTPLAAAIKLVVDFGSTETDLALPNGITDTFAFVSNMKVVTEFIDDAKVKHSQKYEDAVNNIYSNSRLISSGVDTVSAPFADSYYLAGADGGFERKGRFVLNADGTGAVYHNKAGKAVVSWEHTNEGVVITYPSNFVLNSGIDYSTSPSANYETIITRQLIKWFRQSPNSDQLMITDTTYRRYPGGEFPDKAPEDSNSFTNSVKNKGVLNAADILEIGKVYAFPIPEIIKNVSNPKNIENVESSLKDKSFISSSQMIFNGSFTDGGSVTVTGKSFFGDGSSTDNDVIMQWSIDDKGHLNITGSKNYNYVFLRASNNKTSFVNVIDLDNGIAESGNVLLKESTWTPESAVGIYDLTGFSLNYVGDYFWLEINADGTALTVWFADYNSNGILEDSEKYIAPGLWKINPQGHLLVRRYKVNRVNIQSYDYCKPTEWNPADTADCVLYHEREWNLHQVDGKKHYFQQTHKFFNDPNRQSLNPPNDTGHILSFSSFLNIRWDKVDARPTELPANPPAKVNQSLIMSKEIIELEGF